MTTPLDILVVAPHPDDAELGMGGAILKFLAAGLRVGVLDLTDGEPTPHGSVEIRARETAAASALLGLCWRDNLGLPNRSLEPTLAARAMLASIIRQTRPRWLFAPYWIDAHPDHLAATAGRGGPLLGQAVEDRPARRAILWQASRIIPSGFITITAFIWWPHSRRSPSISATFGNRSWRPSLAITASSSPGENIFRHRFRKVARRSRLLGQDHWRPLWRAVRLSRTARVEEHERVDLAAS